MSTLARLELRVEERPAAADMAAVDDAIDAATIRAGGDEMPRLLAVFARDRSGTVVGGVHGWTWAGCSELVSMWVTEDLRRQGVGDALLRRAEAEAVTRGCRQVMLFAHGDHVPHLYSGAGYHVVGEVEDYPAGSTAYWLRKRLDGRPEPTQVGRLVQAGIKLAIVGLVVRDVVDDAGVFGRRVSAAMGQWWSVLEHRERKDARRAEVAYIASRMRRR